MGRRAQAKPRDVDLYVRNDGTPKGVKREPSTPEQMRAYAELMRTVYGVTKGCRVLIGGPLYHASPNACLRQAIVQAELMLLQTRLMPNAHSPPSNVITSPTR